MHVIHKRAILAMKKEKDRRKLKKSYQNANVSIRLATQLFQRYFLFEILIIMVNFRNRTH